METLSSNAQKVLSHLTEDDVLSLAKDLICIPSPTESEKDVATYLFNLLKKVHTHACLLLWLFGKIAVGA